MAKLCSVCGGCISEQLRENVITNKEDKHINTKLCHTPLMNKCHDYQEGILANKAERVTKVCRFKKSTRVGPKGRCLNIAHG